LLSSFFLSSFRLQFLPAFSSFSFPLSFHLTILVCVYMLSFIFTSILPFLFRYIPLILSDFPYNFPPIFPSSTLPCFLPLIPHLTLNVLYDRRGMYFGCAIWRDEYYNITIPSRHKLYCRV
jgi:hypothetical protein